MAKRNYGYEKYQKELRRQQKKEEKERRKQGRVKPPAEVKPDQPQAPSAPPGV